MVVLGVVAVVYGFLVAMFFFCCGVGNMSYFDPSHSPLRSWATILLVWPLVGLACVMLDGAPGDLVRLTKRGVPRAVERLRGKGQQQ
jgi:hypothetical protein